MQENLARGLQTVSRAVSSRATLPVLANVLLKTQDAGLKLTATNLEIGISSWVPGKVEGEGEITVPAKLITDLVASLPNQRIDLELSVKDRTLKLTCGGSRASIKGIEADEFPVVAAIGEAPTTAVASRALREALTEVVFAAGGERLSTLSSIVHPPIAVLALGFRREQVTHPLDGLGFLVPEVERRRVLGIED